MKDMQSMNAMSALKERIRAAGPLCVGLDADPSHIPPEIRSRYESDADAALAYNESLIAETAACAACFKVQSAYYEAMGIAGIQAYARTLRLARGAGIPVIADVKRGDIASTARAYARAHFSGDFEADIATVNPYMGFDTLEPFIDFAERKGKGVFVLLRTSNPGARDIELQTLASGENVLSRVGDFLLDTRDRFVRSYGADVSPIGAVVGCTDGADARKMRDAYKGIFFLIPGYGAQGGSAAAAKTLIGDNCGIVNSSRGILTAWKTDAALEEKRGAGALSLEDITGAAVRAAEAAVRDLRS